MLAQCELCKVPCQEHELVSLRSEYQVAGIHKICPECARWGNETLHSMPDSSANMRAAILKRAVLSPPGPVESALRRLLRGLRNLFMS